MKPGAGSVKVEDGRALVTMGGERLSLPLRPLPQSLQAWFAQGRKEGYDSLLKGRGPGKLFSRHLPVISTTSGPEPFSTRLAHKGVGFLPGTERLEEFLALYEELLERTGQLPPEDSFAERLRATARLLEEPGSADPRLLGSLEIFGGGTFANLSRRPLASLLFTEQGHGYRSFQLDCAVQIVEPPDPRFRFLFLARSLFEKDPFHITQPGVRCAYLFWIVGIHDKTPFPIDEDQARHRLSLEGAATRDRGDAKK